MNLVTHVVTLFYFLSFIFVVEIALWDIYLGKLVIYIKIWLLLFSRRGFLTCRTKICSRFCMKATHDEVSPSKKGSKYVKMKTNIKFEIISDSWVKFSLESKKI